MPTPVKFEELVISLGLDYEKRTNWSGDEAALLMNPR